MNRNLITLIVILLSLSACGSRSELHTPMSNPMNPLPPCPDSPNCVRVSETFSPDPDSLYAVIKSSLESIGADSLDEDRNEHRYHAVFRIPVFGWKDDVHVQVDSTESGSVAHIRSASRVGYSDLGVNKRRVKKLINHIHKSLNNH